MPNQPDKEHQHDHDHDHGHDHADDHSHDPGPFQPDEEVHSYYQFLGLAIRDLMIEKGHFTAEDVRKAIEYRDSVTPAIGARVVAKAWVDPDYKARLLVDANAAVKELGIDMGATTLYAVENTPKVHNVIVCTLCSCYPRNLLGLPPSWYKSFEYRSRVVREPRQVLREFGTPLPESVEVRVHDSTADIRYLVLPMRPEDAGGLSESQLAERVTRDCMVGVAVLT
jgi:nitrile hydratase